MFHFRVEMRVDHGDREIEFHTLIKNANVALRYWPEMVHGDGYDFGNMSCEQIAEQIIMTMKAHGFPGIHAVEVWEDAENGSRVEA
jgi:hypothetical protein